MKKISRPNSPSVKIDWSKVLMSMFVIASILGPSLAAQDDFGICRTAPFWGKHSGDDNPGSQNLTQTLLDGAGPLSICGMHIFNTDLGSYGSALETMCISKTAESEYQLIQELTATGLNCLIDGLGPYCGNSGIADLFAACNATCLVSGRDFSIDECVLQLGCLNDGGFLAADDDGDPFCATGMCDDGSPCGMGYPCDVGRCSSTLGCDDQPLCNDFFCFEPVGPPGSPRLCHEAVKNGEPNRPPVADAGDDQTVDIYETVYLDGAGSWDPDGDLLDFSWALITVPGDSSASLDDPSTVSPSFDVDTAGVYVAELVVDDGEVSSTPDTVAITTEPGNTPPVADAGPDQTVETGATVHLDGSDSSDVDGDSLTFLWSLEQSPSGSAAFLDDPTSVTPILTTDIAGDYVLQLVVNDGLDDSDPDWVIISGNTPPVADAGDDQTVETGATIELDGTGSSDVDNDSLTFDWSFTAQPVGSTAVLDDPTAVMPTFVADKSGTYVVQLIVNDGVFDSEPDTVTISGNSRPVADAGEDQSVEVADVVQLDGSGSFDADEDPLDYLWALTVAPAGSSAFLDDPARVDPTFQADLVGTYGVQLIVNDGVFDSDPDTVAIVTEPGNTQPVADAGPDQQVDCGDTAYLDGGDSFDADGDPLTYSWALTVVPDGSLAQLDDATASGPSFVADLPGTYLVQLIVNDGTVNSDPDTVVVEAFALFALTLGPDPLDLLTIEEGQLTVTIDAPATAGGIEVQLTSSHPSIASVPASADIAEGQTSESFVVTAGEIPGDAIITAASSGMDSATSTVHVATRTMTLDMPEGALVGVGRTATLVVTLDDPAPEGGTVITVASDDPAILGVLPPGTATVAAGETVGQVEIEGIAEGITAVDAAAPGFDGASLEIGVTASLIGLPTTLLVPLGQQEPIPITIQPDSAPPGGLEVTLTSDDPAVEVLTPTVTIPAGAFAANGTLFGASPGTATVRATAPGYASFTSLATTSAELNIVEASVIILDIRPNNVTVRLEAGGSVTPAPPGGVAVSMTADDPECVADTAAIIPEGSSQVTVELAYGGSAALPCASVVTAAGEGLTPDTIIATVQETTITVYSPGGSGDGFDVGAGLQDGSAFFAQLSAIQHGGVTVTISSSDPSLALVAPDASTPGSDSIDVAVADGQNRAYFHVQGLEEVTGSPVITASAPDFNEDTLGVDIVQPVLDLYSLVSTIDTLDPDAPFWVRAGVSVDGTYLSRVQNARIGGGGLTATVTNSNGTVAELVTTATTGQSVTVPVAEGLYYSPISVALGGVAFSPLTPGMTDVTATIPGFLTTAYGAQSVTVTSPTITVFNPFGLGGDGFDVGAGLQDGSAFYAHLSATQHGGVTVTITSSDPSRALVASDASTPGSVSIDVAVPDGQNRAYFFVQGMEGVTGSSVITTSAPGFSVDTIGVDIVQPVLDLYSLVSTIGTLDPDVPFWVRVGVSYDGTYLSRVQHARFGGGGLNATVTNSNGTVAELVTTATTGQSVTVPVAEGLYHSPVSVALGGAAFSPLTPGTTDVAATIPGFLTTAYGAQSVTVAAPELWVLNPGGSTGDGFDIGAGLQDGFFYALLSGAQHGGVTVTITSSDPSRALVAPDASTPGSASIDVVVADGQLQAYFFVQGMEGVTGSSVITASAPGFSDDTIGVDIVQPALDFASLVSAIDTLDPDNPFYVRVGISSGGIFVERTQNVRFGGSGLTVAVTNSNATVAELVTTATTGQSVTVPIAAGLYYSPTSVALGGVAFSPLTPGVTDVTATIPGFLTTVYGTQSVTVTSPEIWILVPGGSTGDGFDIGAGLQDGSAFYAQLSATQHGGVPVTITSSDPSRALVAPDASTPGSASVDVVVADGQSLAPFFIQGMEGATGSPVITASAPGFTDDTLGVDIVQPALDLYALVGTIDTLDPDAPFHVRVGVSSNGISLTRGQAARPGGGGLTASVTNSNAPVAELVTTAITGQSVSVFIAEGWYHSPLSVAQGGVALSPLVPGITNVTATIPDFITTTYGTQTVTVIDP